MGWLILKEKKTTNNLLQILQYGDVVMLRAPLWRWKINLALWDNRHVKLQPKWSPSAENGSSGILGTTSANIHEEVGQR